MKHAEITDRIIRAFYTVYNQLGYGFLEKVYERALLLELRDMGLAVAAQVPIRVKYKGTVVGDYCADLLVEDLIIVELKAAEAIAEEHKIQLVNYLKATDKEVGLLLNFGKNPDISRKLLENHLK